MIDDNSHPGAAPSGPEASSDLATEQLHRAFLDAPYPAMIYADNGRVLLINRAWTKITGYQLSDIPTISAWTEKAYSDKKDAVRTVVDALYLSENRAGEEFIVRCRNGEQRIWKFSSSPLGVHTDGSRLVLSMAIDITEAKHAEDNLRKRDSRLRALFDLESLGVAHVSLDSGRIIDINKGYETLTGYSREELLKMNFREITHPDDREHDWELFTAAVKGLAPYRNEKRYLRKDGTSVWVRLNVAFEYDTERRPVQTVAICEDISERKEAEAEQNRLKMAVEQSGEMFMITQPDGTILYVNRAFVETTGYSQSEILGANPRILKSGKQDAEHYRAMWAALMRGETWQGRIINRRKDGSLYTADTVISPIRDNKEHTLYYAAVARDITEQLRISNLLAQAQKMDSIGRLAGGVAHDFNNMLSVILGRVDLALDDLPMDGPLRESLQEVHEAASRSADLTRQLLAFARRQPAAPQLLDLNQTLKNMLKMLTRLIGEDIDLIWKPDYSIPSVRMDPSQVDQILTNLCVNARDAIGTEAGKITIESGFARFDEAYCLDHPGFVPGNFAMLAVSDNGSGLDDDIREHLFEPFYTTKSGTGTGLGLATVYGIVKQNQGFINVYSEPGNGTTFRIYLPAQREAVSAQAESSDPPLPARGQETILVVEDEPAVLEVARTMLTARGYKVIGAASPEQALEAAAMHDEEICLLITDVVMPGMNGKELAQKLLGLYPSLKCIYMSGYTANVIAHRGVLDEGVHFIQKPFSIADLTAKVRAVLDA